MPPPRFAALAFVAILAACQAQDAPERKAATEVSQPAASEPADDPTATAAPDGASEVPGAFPASFRALGTEPFWAIHVSDGTLRYMTPENQEGTVVPFTRIPAGDGEVSLDAVLNGRKLHLAGRIAECSDGMSDRVYPFTVTVTLGDGTLEGCARPIEG